MLTYIQRTGELKSGESLIAKGYSGNGVGLNNPAMESVANQGPIPAHLWLMKEMIEHDGDLGPRVIILVPVQGRGPGEIVLAPHPYGRDLFRMHGDNALLNQSASHGCIIQPRFARERAWNEPDKLVNVISG